MSVLVAIRLGISSLYYKTVKSFSSRGELLSPLCTELSRPGARRRQLVCRSSVSSWLVQVERLFDVYIFWLSAVTETLYTLVSRHYFRFSRRILTFRILVRFSSLRTFERLFQGKEVCLYLRRSYVKSKRLYPGHLHISETELQFYFLCLRRVTNDCFKRHCWVAKHKFTAKFIESSCSCL